MLGHQLRQNLVLSLDLLLQVSDPLLVGGVVRSRLLLEGGRAVLEELLLPVVEDRGLESQLIAELRDWLLLQQMPPQEALLTGGEGRRPGVLSFTLGERLLHFELNRNISRIRARAIRRARPKKRRRTSVLRAPPKGTAVKT
jgi:hypothetical protein